MSSSHGYQVGDTVIATETIWANYRPIDEGTSGRVVDLGRTLVHVRFDGTDVVVRVEPRLITHDPRFYMRPMFEVMR